MSERRTLQEQLGVAMNAGGLRIEPREPGMETSLLRLAALGAASLHIRHGADRGGQQGRGCPVAEMMAKPGHAPSHQDALAGELVSDLIHIRDGRQFERLPAAIACFATWCSYRRQFADETRFPDRARLALLLPKFSARTMHEWLSDKCIACGGSGKLERSEGGSWIRPRGRMQRNATFRPCTPCHGSRRAMPSHTARRMALGIALEVYEAETWARHFSAGLAWLTTLLYRRVHRPLTVQLERSKKRV